VREIVVGSKRTSDRRSCFIDDQIVSGSWRWRRTCKDLITIPFSLGSYIGQ
jgi:hypothetical protein